MSEPTEPTPPNRPGQLTPAQKAKALAFVKERWGESNACPFHPGPTRWVIDSTVGQLPGYAPDAPFGSSGLIFPVLVVTCQVCAFMVPLNAIMAGVIEPDPPEVRDKAGDPPVPEAK